MQEADGRPVAAIHGDARRGRRAVVGVERAGAGRTQDSRTPTLRPLPSEPLPPRPGTLGMELRLVLTGLFSSPHKEGTTPTPSQSWAPTEREEIYFFVSRQWTLSQAVYVTLRPIGSRTSIIFSLPEKIPTSVGAHLMVVTSGKGSPSPVSNKILSPAICL